MQPSRGKLCPGILQVLRLHHSHISRMTSYAGGGADVLQRKAIQFGSGTGAQLQQGIVGGAGRQEQTKVST